MRYDLNGDGVPDLIASSAAYTGNLACWQRTTTAAGQTPPSCKGYELANDISLAAYSNWTPVPGWGAIFNGNGFNRALRRVHSHLPGNADCHANPNSDRNAPIVIEATPSRLRPRKWPAWSARPHPAYRVWRATAA